MIPPATDAQGHARSLLREGAARHAEGELDAAAEIYARVLRFSPDEPDALNLSGVLARTRGELERAVGLTGRALALRPGAPVFLASHGASLAEAGRPAEALPLLRRAVAARPEDAVSHRNLGQALATLGRSAEALPHLRRAAALAPGPETLLALAHGLREAGEPAAAAQAARAALEGADPELAAQARFLLAATGDDPVPGRAPAGYVRDLFDRYAPRFDQHLVDELHYRTPALLVALLGRAGVAPAASRDVLDLGCGTGLSGRALRPFARHLEGVDLSPRMLAEAARTGCYDELRQADLLDVLPARRGAHDLVAAADVLNYLGDLGAALAGIAAALAPGGVAALSFEVGDVAPYALGEGMRFRHHPDHVLGLVEASRTAGAGAGGRGAPAGTGRRGGGPAAGAGRRLRPQPSSPRARASTSIAAAVFGWRVSSGVCWRMASRTLASRRTTPASGTSRRRKSPQARARVAWVRTPAAASDAMFTTIRAWRSGASLACSFSTAYASVSEVGSSVARTSSRSQPAAKPRAAGSSPAPMSSSTSSHSPAA